MPFYLRKSKSFSPIRLNFSKSGVGASVGVKGARVAFGPRGTQINMGRGGIYYRKSLATPTRQRQVNAPIQQPLQDADPEAQAIVSADVGELIDTNTAEVLTDLNTPRGNWFLRIFGIVKPVPLSYELDDEATTVFNQLKASIRSLAGAKRVWLIESSQATDAKHHAGADALLTREPILVGVIKPPRIETNVEVLCIDTGGQKLMFFPDRLLVHQRGKYGAVAYQDLKVTLGQTRFREDQGVPSDAQVVGESWQYVNKSGGPDRRFKDNRQIPIALYGEIGLESPTGLKILLQVSKKAAADQCATALAASMKSVANLARN
jgi:hypothetical protein